MERIQPQDSRSFRKALGSFTTGVTVVTSSVGGRDAGLTANSFNSASLNPPMVLWSLGKNSSSLGVFMAADHFAVHILSSDQEATSRRFATSGIDRFEGLPVRRGAGQVPLLDGCSAHFECRTAYRYEGGDHVIFVGEVLSFSDFGRAPLVFQGGQYGTLVRPQESDLSSSAFGSDFLGFLMRRAYAQMMFPLREDVSRLGLDEVHRHILSILSMGEGRSTAQIARLMELTGHKVDAKHFRALEKRNLITIDQGSEDPQVAFTPSGRDYAMQHIASYKAVEADALRGLSPTEARVLKTLLARVVRNTSSGVPASWRQENYWLANNMWGVDGATGSSNANDRED